MVEFVCDDKDIEKALRRLYKQVVDNGGFVHDKLTIGCQKGDFKISVAGSVPWREKILVLPSECLLPVAKYKLYQKGNTIVMLSHDKDLSKGQVDLMETMIELYNLTGKLAAQKKTSTLGLYHKDKNLLERLLSGRSLKGTPYLDKLKSADQKTFILDSFIKTRVLGFKKKIEISKKTSKKASKKGTKKDNSEKDNKEPTEKIVSEPVLMPIIDFINHNPLATGFLCCFDDETKEEGNQDIEKQSGLFDQDGITVLKSCPIEGSGECYVNYGPYDAMDTLLHYNYVEKNTFYVKSVPLKINLPGLGTINILSQPSNPQHKNLPEKVKDLTFFIPNMVLDVKKREVVLGFLYIPQEKAPRALRRVLGIALNQFGLNLGEERMMEAILFLEKRIIDENYKYFKELLDYMNTYKPKPDVKLIAANIKEMAEVELEKIEKYPFFEHVRQKEDTREEGEKSKKKSASVSS